MHRIGSKIGSGQFGTVSEGVWNVSTSQSVPMAAKTLDGTSDSDRIKFYKEVVIMGQFKHPNVVGLYGVAKKDGKVCVCGTVWLHYTTMTVIENDDSRALTKGRSSQPLESNETNVSCKHCKYIAH